MTAESYSITVNGTPLSFIGYWGEPVVTHRRRGGSWALTWKMDLPRGFHHEDLVRGAAVRGLVGPTKHWRGILTEPDLDSMEFTAQGSCRMAETALALDLSGATAHPGDAILFASGRGVIDWGTLDVLTPVPGDALPDGLLTLADLLDAYVKPTGKNWRVDTQGLLSIYDDPTEPVWMVPPGSTILGVADDDYWTGLVATYLDPVGAYDKVYASDPNAPAPHRERGVDLTPRGRLTTVEAQAILDGMLAKGLARTGWTNGIEVASGELRNMGYTRAALSAINAGEMVHLPGLRDERGVAGYTNVVVDETVWNVSEGRLQLNPVGLAPRDLSSIIESMGGVLT